MPSNRSGGTISYVRSLPSLIRRLLENDALQSSIRAEMMRIARNDSSSKSILVVEAVEDTFYLGLFGRIAASLQQRDSLRTDLLFPRSLNVGEGKSILRFLNARCIAGWPISVKWSRLYHSFASDVAYSSSSFHPIHDLIDLVGAWRKWRALGSKETVLALTIDGVPVGDLINDSYLRFKPAKELQIHDRYLWIAIWQAHRDVRRARRYFSSSRPRLFLTTYATYIQHGVAVRAALMAGVHVFSFGNSQDFCKSLCLTDWLHTKKADGYAAEFELLRNKEGKIAAANETLSARTDGVVDSATAYMRVSAYAESDEPVPDVSDAVVIFLHDFYDSPHVYYDLVFSDFWDWICCTIDALSNAGITYFIKPHPNQISLSGEVLQELKDRYPGIAIIPPTITNRQLALAGMRCAVTVYGTVAHEMAFFGIPTITCARHPHVSFGFCLTAHNKEEYLRALRSPGIPGFDATTARNESLRFFHMHNQNLDKDELALRDSVLQLRSESALPDADGGNVVARLRNLETFPAYRAFVETCGHLVAGKS